MYWEEPRVPGLPGAEDVTDGSVDYYDTDWETVENGALEGGKCSHPNAKTPARPPNNLFRKQTGTNRRTGV